MMMFSGEDRSNLLHRLSKDDAQRLADALDQVHFLLTTSTIEDGRRDQSDIGNLSTPPGRKGYLRVFIRGVRLPRDPTDIFLCPSVLRSTGPLLRFFGPEGGRTSGEKRRGQDCTDRLTQASKKTGWQALQRSCHLEVSSTSECIAIAWSRDDRIPVRIGVRLDGEQKHQ